MEDYDILRHLSNQLLRWTRFRHKQASGDAKKKEFLATLPSSMQRKLITAMFGDFLLKVPLFQMLQAEDCTFMEDL